MPLICGGPGVYEAREISGLAIRVVDRPAEHVAYGQVEIAFNAALKGANRADQPRDTRFNAIVYSNGGHTRRSLPLRRHSNVQALALTPGRAPRRHCSFTAAQKRELRRHEVSPALWLQHANLVSRTRALG